MDKKLKMFVENLFQHTTSGQHIEALKEEVMHKLYEEYENLLIEGNSKEEAYLIATSHVGDIQEMISGLDESAIMITTKDIEKRRQKSACVISVAVVVYILCFGLVVWLDTLGLLLSIPFIAIATGFVVYDRSTKPYSIGHPKEIYVQTYRTEKQRKNSIVKESISSILWISTVIIYLLIGFLYQGWSYAWLVFIIVVLIDQVVGLVFELKE